MELEPYDDVVRPRCMILDALALIVVVAAAVWLCTTEPS